MPDPQITERTLVRLSISSWWHVFVILSVIIGIYFALRQDVTSAISQSAQNAQDLRSAQQSITDMRLDVQSIKDNVLYFRQQYEQDMRKYIRDPPQK